MITLLPLRALGANADKSFDVRRALILSPVSALGSSADKIFYERALRASTNTFASERTWLKH